MLLTGSLPHVRPLTSTASNLPDGLSLTTADAHTAVIGGTTAAGAAQSAPCTATVSATDGTYSASRTFVWNVAPRITLDLIDDQQSEEGDTVSLPVTAASPDGLPLTFSVSNLPDGLTLTTVDDHSALISGTIAT